MVNYNLICEVGGQWNDTKEHPIVLFIESIEYPNMYWGDTCCKLKREVTKYLNKEIIAFANTKGGVIYIGYDDDSSLVGIQNAKEVLDKISNMISDTIDPNLIFNI